MCDNSITNITSDSRHHCRTAKWFGELFLLLSFVSKFGTCRGAHVVASKAKQIRGTVCGRLANIRENNELFASLH